MTLASRFKLNGNYIRAWNGMTGDGRNSDGWTIIDCMMNLPLLYWASEELGDDRFKQIAMAHADTAMTHHVRPDGSVNHIVVHDLESGEMIDVVNLKLPTEMFGTFGASDGVHPAYHMNKRHWISVILNGSIPEDFTERLIAKSFDLTYKKQKNVVK